MVSKLGELVSFALVFIALLLLFQSCPAAEARNHCKHCPGKLSCYNFLSEQLGNISSGDYNALQSSKPAGPHPFRFGETYTFDMPLLAGPSLASKLVGRVQGTYVFVSKTGGLLFVSETFQFNTTRCNGTFSGVGLEELGKASSKPIVGGTGDFELVTGIASTVLLSSRTVNSQFEAWFKYTFRFKFGSWPMP